MSTNLLSTLPAAQTIVWTGRTGLASSATTGFTITPTANANVLSSTGYSLTGGEVMRLHNLPTAGQIGKSGVVALHAPEGAAYAPNANRGLLKSPNHSGTLSVVNRGVLPSPNVRGAA